MTKTTYHVRIGRYDHNGEWQVTQLYGSAGTRLHAQRVADEYNRKHRCNDAYVALLS